MPNNPEDQDSFVQLKADEHFYNEFHFNTFWDIMKETFLDAVVQKYRNRYEDRALIEMCERSALADTLLVCDRGYEAYNNIAHIQQANRKYVMRIKGQGVFEIAYGLGLPDEDEFDEYVERSLPGKSSLDLKSPARRNKNKYNGVRSILHAEIQDIKNSNQG